MLAQDQTPPSTAYVDVHTFDCAQGAACSKKLKIRIGGKVSIPFQRQGEGTPLVIR